MRGAALQVSVARTDEDRHRVLAAKDEVFAREYGGTPKPVTVTEWDRRGVMLFIEDAGRVVAGVVALVHTCPFTDRDFYCDRFVNGAAIADVFEGNDVVLELTQLFSVNRSTTTLAALVDGIRAMVRSNPVIQSRRNASVRCFYGALTAAHALMYREVLSDSWHDFRHIKEMTADAFGLDPLFISAQLRVESLEQRAQLPRSA